MTIKWDSKISVGNSDIDTEHKLIIAHINALEQALLHPAEKDYLKFFFDQLFEFAAEHFYHEEQLQLKFRFPHYEENKKGHQALITELEVIKTIIYCFIEKADPTQEEAKEMTEKVNELMRNWFIDHIIKSDMKMKGFLDNVIITHNNLQADKQADKIEPNVNVVDGHRSRSYELVVIKDKSLIRDHEEKWAKNFQDYATRWGFKASDLGREVIVNMHVCRIAGARPHAKHPILVKNKLGEFLITPISMIKIKRTFDAEYYEGFDAGI